jgi:hypothetical protein
MNKGTYVPSIYKLGVDRSGDKSNGWTNACVVNMAMDVDCLANQSSILLRYHES